MYFLVVILNFKICGYWKFGVEDDESVLERFGMGCEDFFLINSRFSKVRFFFVFISFRIEIIFFVKIKRK